MINCSEFLFFAKILVVFWGFFLQSACVVQLAMFYRFCDKNNSIYIYIYIYIYILYMIHVHVWNISYSNNALTNYILL